MTPIHLRRALHTAHAIASILLLGTGLLLEFPELRGLSIGGYGGRVVSIHLWVGVAFMLVPLAALALAGRPLVEDLRRRLGPPDPWRWRKSHITGSIVTVVVFSVSGIILWGDDWFPLALWDASRTAHIAFTVLISISLPIHLVAARRKMLARAKEMLGLAESPDSFFDEDTD
jgi:cytochrome b subunit of formate dehydrogenase